MTEPLRDLLGELAGRQPHVADWPGRVHRTVGAGRRRKRLLTGAVAVVLLSAGAGTVVLTSSPPAQDALIGSQASPSPSVVATPSAPAPSASPSAATEPSGQAAPSAQPGPSASPSTAPSPETSAAAEPSAAAPAPSPSYPPSGSQDIVITAQARPERPAVGEEWVLDITVTGFAEGPPYLQEPCVDADQCVYAAFSCPGGTEGKSPPPAREQRVDRTFRHTFSEPGRHEVTLLAQSACSYYRGRDELVVVVEVVEREPAPSPSPSPAA